MMPVKISNVLKNSHHATQCVDINIKIDGVQHKLNLRQSELTANQVVKGLCLAKYRGQYSIDPRFVSILITTTTAASMSIHGSEDTVITISQLQGASIIITPIEED